MRTLLTLALSTLLLLRATAQNVNPYIYPACAGEGRTDYSIFANPSGGGCLCERKGQEPKGYLECRMLNALFLPINATER